MVEDTVLVERARSGDKRAFSELLVRYRGGLRRMLLRMTGSIEDADDLLQDACVRALEGLAALRDASSFKAWIYRIASNLALNHLARRKTRGHEDTEAVESLSADCSELGRVADEELRQLVRAHLGKLPERQRTALLLRIDGELSYAEVAAAMECTVGTAKANVFHAVRALGRLLAPVERELGGITPMPGRD